jgi:hypothetical protein
MKSLSLTQVTDKPVKPEANGYVLYQGPSNYDGQPIVVIATGFHGRGKNAKTGNMIQTWILKADVSPFTALNEKKDSTVCGDCIHSASRQGSCYVNVAQAPSQVYKSWKRGIYPVLTDMNIFKGQAVRFGSYGDPAMVPANIWVDIAKVARMNTGYTHQWKRDFAKGLQGVVQASCDTDYEQTMARSKGWRTFRVVAPGSPLMPKEFWCPASPEGGDKKQCIECGACDGTNRGEARGNVAIVVHGKPYKVNRFIGV